MPICSGKGFSVYRESRVTNITQGEVTGMSNDQKSVNPPSTEAGLRRCAFYQASMSSDHVNRRVAEKSEASAMKHRCMLNPGRAEGPDGIEIGPTICTMERQSACQKARRDVFARLNGMVAAAILVESKL